MFYFRINKLKIVDNREKRHVLRLFDNDRAEVKLNSFVTTDETRLPDMDELVATRDLQRQRELITAAVEHVVGSRIMTTIQNVTDNHVMTFGDTGYVLYQTERIPSHFDWLLLAIESDRDVREIGEDMLSVVHHEKFDDFISQIVSLAATAANPSYAAAVGIAKFVAQAVAEGHRHKADDMIGILYTSLNRREHYPHGERKRDHVPDLTNNMFIDYSVFGFEPMPQPVPQPVEQPMPQPQPFARPQPIGQPRPVVLPQPQSQPQTIAPSQPAPQPQPGEIRRLPPVAPGRPPLQVPRRRTG